VSNGRNATEMRPNEKTLLVADVGGTKTDCACVPVGAPEPGTLEVTTFRNDDFADAEGVLDACFAGPARGCTPRIACIAVAGPVVGGAARLTNRTWTFDAQHLAARYAVDRVFLVNDAVACGWAVASLRDASSVPLVRGTGAPRGTRLVLSPGTGLGVSIVVRSGPEPIVLPSEGGNAAFAPTALDQTALWQFMQEEIGRVRVEDLCSGPGIARIHRHLMRSDPTAVAERDREIVALPADRRTTAIVDAALAEGGSSLCRRAIDRFIEILAGVATDCALAFWATGGIYVAGRLPTRLRPLLVDRFEREFSRLARATPLPTDLPVRLVTAAHPVLVGAFRHAVTTLGASGGAMGTDGLETSSRTD